MLNFGLTSDGHGDNLLVQSVPVEQVQTGLDSLSLKYLYALCYLTSKNLVCNIGNLEYVVFFITIHYY